METSELIGSYLEFCLYKIESLHKLKVIMYFLIPASSLCAFCCISRYHMKIRSVSKTWKQVRVDVNESLAVHLESVNKLVFCS